MPKKPVLVNSYTRDKDGGDWTWSGGLGRSARNEASARQAARRAYEDSIKYETCNRCRGTMRGPNPFIAERKCKACDGSGMIAVSA